MSPVVDLNLRLLDPALIPGALRRVEQVRHRGVVVAVAGTDRGGLSSLAQLFKRVLPDCLQHPVAGPELAVFDGDQRLFDEQGEQIEGLVTLDVTDAANFLRRIEVEIAKEHSRAAEEDLFRLREQRVRPVDRRPQRLLAAHSSSRAAGQQPEAVVQAVEDLSQRQRTNPCGRKLNRQGYAIQAPADLHHGGRITLGHDEIRADMARTVDE
jgi:hypothetical protein